MDSRQVSLALQMKGNDNSDDLSKFAINREENNTAPIFKNPQSDAASNHNAEQDMNQTNNSVTSPSKENKAQAAKVS
jgi:hypothetical protein